MKKRSSRRFSRFLCCSARTPSSPDAEHRTPRPIYPSITTEGPSSSNIPPIQNDGQNCGYSSSLPINNAPPVSSPSSLTINKGPTVPSSSQSNTITDNDLQPLPTSSNVQTVDTVSLFQANPSPTADVLEESSSQPSEIVVAHRDEPHPVLPSTSSSRVTALPDLIEKMNNDARTIMDNHNLDAFIHDMFMLLEAIKESESQKSKKSQKKPIAKESQNKAEKATNKFLSITSTGLLKLKDLLLEGVNGICSLGDVLPAHEAKQVARDLVKGLGQTHWVTSCFLLVSYILDRFDTLSSNQEGCLDLLEQMYYLAVDLKKAAGIAKLEGWEYLNKDGIKLIVEASLMCCSQIDRSKLSMFFTTTVDAAKLLHFKNTLATFNVNMVRKMVVWICSSLLCNKVRPAVHREESYPEYAVGMEEPLKSVAKLLHLESEENAVAVTVHGFGGIGKSTLADAVFARYFVKDCKYSVVRLDKSTKIKKRAIVEMQKNILKDLMRRTESGRESQVIEEGDRILDFTDFVVGRERIGDLLQKEAAFIYIDDVADPESLKELLVSSKWEDAKKLRLLITTRDIHVHSQLGNMKREVHQMQPLSHDQGKSFLSKQIYNGRDDSNEQITDKELNEIVNISGGIPKILDMITGMMQSAKNQKKAFRIIKQNSKELTGDTFRNIEKAIFAYNDLPPECKSPFLDICFFLKGWKWETVENIVGESQLEMLQKRALVSKDEDMNVHLHDIILKIGKEKAQDGEVKARDTRIDFTEAPVDEIQDFFDKMQDKKYLQSIQGLWFSDQACNIPVTTLNSMKDSLRIFGHKMVLVNGQCENNFSKLLVYKGETPHSPFKWSRLTNLKFLSYQPQNLDLLKELQIPSSNLKHIELDGSLCSVSEILCTDIQQLQALQVLRLINFHNLEKLPEEWGKHLSENLKELSLSNCTAMKQLTGFISQLTGLQILKLDNCCNLKQWPEGCEPWSCLKNLTFLSCQPQNLNLLKEIPPSNLKHIELDGSLCSASEILSSDIQQLRALQVLRLINFHSLEKLPEEWGEYLRENLKELTLSNCTAMKELPGSISQLTSLKILKLDN